MKNLYVLGATGSIGRQVLEIASAHPDEFRIAALSANQDLEGMTALIGEHHPEYVAMGSSEAAEILRVRFPDLSIGAGDEGLVSAATLHPEDRDGLLVNALVGSCGLLPTFRALENGRDVALANKETLVIGGDLIMPLARERGARIYPVDSEHSAIWQCLRNADPSTVRRLVITASGGAFRDKTREELAGVTPEDALRHPNWSMGAKITVDSATMMNKGFEIIEAHHLFGIPGERVETVLHPESYVHSFVEFVDGSLLAQISDHDMRLPISYALFGGDRRETPVRPLDLAKIGSFTFSPLEPSRYPCLGMAREAMERGGLLPCILNAANEAAVRLFLEKRISFLEIEAIVRGQMDQAIDFPHPSLDDLLVRDRSVRDAVFRQYLK